MNIVDKKNRIQELINVLNDASNSYYNDNVEKMSNLMYDELYDELVKLENETNIHYSNSPTNKVGYTVNKELKEVVHEKPMLSLDKTKSREELKEWLSDKIGILSYKLDGLTIVITYDNGEISSALTRGDGEKGELITDNVKNFLNIPVKISYKKHLVIRGEAIITYSDFDTINELYSEDSKYKNPRNLCSGSVRQLDPNITKQRRVRFFAFSIVDCEDDETKNFYEKQLEFLKNLGFDTVLYKKVTRKNIDETIDWFSKDILTNDNPSDGLVLMYDDLQYGISLGTTSKFPKNAIAFKWRDEIVKTTLIDVEWSASRTGLINPVAIFTPVEIEGTTVKRASLHNLSIVEDLELGIGDEIEVYKANMIIPQVAKNLTKSNNLKIIDKCPACLTKVKIYNDNGIKTVHCDNINCPIKHIKNFENFVSKNCMDIEGISTQTIEKFINLGIIKEYADLYKLEKHKNLIMSLDGFGEKSYNNIYNAIEKRRVVDCFRVINSLGILGIGPANAKVISKYFNFDIEKIRIANVDDFCKIDTIGPILAESIYSFFKDLHNKKIVDNLLKEITIIRGNKNSNILENKIFVITGSLIEYKNRDELVLEIEKYGGKVSQSVSSKTSYLINNDINSNSTKNKMAKKLNIEIINEKKFKEMLK